VIRTRSNFETNSSCKNASDPARSTIAKSRSPRFKSLPRKLVISTCSMVDYELRGWDKKTGIPTKAKLDRIGLEFVATELEKLGKLPE
jgi:aldehyde:ferredoxin oxidoreductase